MVKQIIYSQIINHLEVNNILAGIHGLGKRRSCESQLINTIDYLAKELNLKKLNFTKSFDQVLPRD